MPNKMITLRVGFRGYTREGSKSPQGMETKKVGTQSYLFHYILLN